MTQLRNIDAELQRFRHRIFVFTVVVAVCFFLLLLRLAYLQIWRHEDLLAQAESNRTASVPVVPNRGLILDRNGVVLASNYSAYTLEITPSKSADLEQTIEALSKVVDISARDRRRFKKLMEESRSFESLPIRSRLSDAEVARFATQRFRFPDVEIKARLFRNYPYGELASHVIGYIGRINQAEKEAIEQADDPANYRGTEYIGKLGVEQSYERQLHGITGMQHVETSAGGRAVRRLSSNPATPGDTVVLSLDIKLQHLVEQMYGQRRGAFVAMDPRSGEVLAFVSKPTFDPNMFVDGIDVENWQQLNLSPDKPLLNRALRGTYPPGSTYKPFMALAALETNKRSPDYAVSDPGYFMFGNHRFRDDKEGGHGRVNMYLSIVASCDTYYYTLANEMGVDTIYEQMHRLGFGDFTGIDILGEARGLLPSTDWKRRAYRKPEQQKWYPGETISLGIGQGYNAFTMLQLAQATATVANNGVRYPPRLVSATVDAVSGTKTASQVAQPVNLGLSPAHIDVIREAMVGVTIAGTSARAFAGAAYASAGKTGTAQAVGIGQNEKYDSGRIAEHLRDHALYIAYAPADKPTIALAMVVENAGFGAEHAAPIARRVLDYWLSGKYPNEQDMEAVSKGQASAPIGVPRNVADVVWPPVRPVASPVAP